MHKSILLVCFLSALFCLPLSGLSDEVPEVIKVTATGMGHNSDEALKDAFKNAIRRAVGVYVITETTMNNEDIDEKVYANSDATIATHAIIDTKTMPNNLVQVTIKAEVLKRKIAQAVAGNEKTTVISRSSIAQTSTHLDSMEEALKSLDHLFRDFPASVLRVETVGKPYIDDSQNVTADIIPMKQNLRLSVDYRKYQQFVSKLCALYDSMGYPKGTRGILTEDKVKAMSENKQFDNCFCILMLRNPQMAPQRLEDVTSQVYRLPGQVMRHMGEYAGRKVVLLYELADDDGNILGYKEMFVVPRMCYVGRGTSIRKTTDYDSQIAFRVSSGSCFEREVKEEVNTWRDLPLVALLSPFFGYDGWKFDIKDLNPNSWPDVTCAHYYVIPFQVNRRLFEASQNLKIKVSIQNVDTGLDIP